MNTYKRGFAPYALAAFLIGIVGGFSSGAVIFGPTLGSLIITASGCRAMLWVCTAICIVTTGDGTGQGNRKYPGPCEICLQ